MLDEHAKALASGPNFASLATLLPDGTPQVQVMWVDTDGEHIMVNTEIHRRKFKNLQANPTATVLIIARDNPWSYAEVRGTMVEAVTGPPARAHIDSLAKKYLGADEYPYPIETERVIVKIAPKRVLSFGG